MTSLPDAIGATLRRRPGFSVSLNKAYRLAFLWLADHNQPPPPLSDYRALLDTIGVELFEGPYGTALRDIDTEPAAYRRYLMRR